MPKINPDIESFARIKVIGVGGSGKNALNHMIDSGVESVEFICMNTDTQDLHHSKAQKKIHIGRNLTKGQGTGMNPEIGREAAEETKAEIQEAIKHLGYTAVLADESLNVHKETEKRQHEIKYRKKKFLFR